MAHRIGIAGITGRMGLLLSEEVPAAGAVLVGGVRRAGTGQPAPAGIELLPNLDALIAASDVVIDFTHASTAQATAAAIAASGKPWVLGASGLSAADEAAVETASESSPVVYASNFSAGVNLVLALCERMGAALPAEVTMPKSWRCTTGKRSTRLRAPPSAWVARWRKAAVESWKT